MARDIHDWPSRTLCDVLEGMREANKTRNYGYLLGLIEEAQYLGNRMEAALSDKKKVEDYRDEIKVLKEEYKNLKKDLPKDEPQVPERVTKK